MAIIIIIIETSKSMKIIQKYSARGKTDKSEVYVFRRHLRPTPLNPNRD